ncbi:probable protein phosphatase 2C 12 [Zingiber officinale]|uniref:probable protein phosphatase 2C 12 n=1 Tax=Zingiber officinale TaxID=94328 RepID=UPI001C4D55F6|nr:probable protein phosphatase 2C 12 [Zingiber officinale]
MAATDGDGMVPLAVLLRREMSWERIENPDIIYGEASESKKGEDFTLVMTECQRVPQRPDTTFSVFALFDGHNGSAAAIYSKENLLNNVLSSIPSEFSRNEWVQALPRALVAGFIKTDKDFKEMARVSGTTVTFVIIDGWVVTVASVGDSRCVLESAEGSVYFLSTDHRLEDNEEEVERITTHGGEVGRMNVAGGAEFGPLRCWPGGLCLSRSIGDQDVGEFILPIPHVKQVKLSNAGGRLVISSDGVWDALSAEKVLSCCRGLPAEAAAFRIVKEAVQPKGIRDDTTCIVVDILPPEKISPSFPNFKRSGKGMFKSMFRRRSSESSLFSDRDYSEADMVEEIFEDGSPVLAHRLDPEYSACPMFRPFNCAICQLEMKPGEGISLHDNSTKHGTINPWDGPFLCAACNTKKEAMEGRR